LKRRIGTGGHKHELTTPGDFARPAGLAVDQEGNLYVADALNNRIEIFDGDGKFVSTFGKAGDGPGYFARPKGVAIDSDDHIWVVDGMQDRVQVFNHDAQLLISFGGHGLFLTVSRFAGIATDKTNRFTRNLPGRVQQFRYVTDAEADHMRKEKDASREKKAGATGKESVPTTIPTIQAKAPGSK
jgi:DNA-binding beta-propeller fold protein YncE